MKQLKMTLKLTVLLMVVCLMTVSCQKDDNVTDIIEPQNQLRKPPSYTANIFNGDSIINANPNLKSKLQRFNDKTALRTMQSSEHDFSIDTTRVQKIQTSSYISYTFTVVRPYPVDDVLENYVITHFNNDTYKQYFISYPIINNNGDISYDMSNANISVLNDDSLVYYRDPNCVSVMVFEEPVCVDMPCDGTPPHTFEQGSECPYWGAIGTATRECTEGGWIDPGCSDGGNVGDDNSNGDPSGDPSGDSNGGTGTNGPGDTNEEEPEEEIVIPMIPTLIQQIENCINRPTMIGVPDSTTITPGLIASLNLSPAQVRALNVYLRVQNQCSEEAQAAFIEALETLSTYTEISYPGMELYYEFEWWLDDDFVEDNFNFGFDIGGGLDNLTAEEKVLVALFPAQALIIRENREPAETETENRFGNNGINNKSDAFRHAFFNAMNTNDAGDFVARKFSNAHESETPPNLILEKQMDLHNNNIGHNIGNNASTFISDQELSNLVYQSLIWGSLRYLFPINYGDPNFWDDPTTPEPNDGDHGITSSTQLIQTNQ